MNELDAFRAEAREGGMPDDAIDWWLRLARPCLYLEKDGSGPVVGHFGGPPALPASVAWPEGTVHLASIDLAALPHGVLDLDLPGDGTLVFFAEPGMVTFVGQVVHVPAGAAVAEAQPPADTPSVYDRFPLHAAPNWSLPENPAASPLYVGESRDDEDDYHENVWCLGNGHRGADEVAVLGGYGLSNTGGLEVPFGRDIVLLAEFFLTEKKVGKDFETDYATLYYTINSDDLAARRFEQVSLASDFHG